MPLSGMMPIRTLIVAALFVLAVACGSDEAASPPRTASATPGIVNVIPTETPVPLLGQSSVQWELQGATQLRQFPIQVDEVPTTRSERDELEARYPASMVEELWNEFLAGSRVLNDVDGSELYDLCSDGTGVWHDVPDLLGKTFRWWTQPGGLGPFEITLVMSFDDGPRGYDSPNSIFQDVFYPSLDDPARFNEGFPRIQVPTNTAQGIVGRPVFIDSPDCD